jgi:hypothetical protein
MKECGVRMWSVFTCNHRMRLVRGRGELKEHEIRGNCWVIYPGGGGGWWGLMAAEHSTTGRNRTKLEREREELWMVTGVFPFTTTRQLDFFSSRQRSVHLPYKDYAKRKHITGSKHFRGDLCQKSIF